MKTLLISFCSLLISINCVAQQNLSVRDLIMFSNCTKLSSFDQKAKEMGFSFTDKYLDSPENKTEYTYNRVISANNYDVRQALAYYDYGTDKPVIVFSTSKKANKSYVSDLGKEATELGFKNQSDNADGFTLYSNDTYKIEIHEYKKDSKTNLYIVAISHR